MSRRFLLALAVPILLATSGAASATCVDSVCTPVGPGSVEGDVDVNGDGVLCAYKKDYAPPPSDWTGPANAPAPYFFSRTQAWGDEYEHRWLHDWDTRYCAPLLCIPNPASSLCVTRTSGGGF